MGLCGLYSSGSVCRGCNFIQIRTLMLSLLQQTVEFTPLTTWLAYIITLWIINISIIILSSLFIHYMLRFMFVCTYIGRGNMHTLGNKGRKSIYKSLMDVLKLTEFPFWLHITRTTLFSTFYAHTWISKTPTYAQHNPKWIK